ncbi:MAG: hypothetical protein D6743_12055 [Calditrichaeota bacterium]|nr:MAG: hypothetical protein D6743_12055 [Calditrichota bacterium]
MKRTLVILLLSLVIGLIFVQIVYHDQVDLWQLAKEKLLPHEKNAPVVRTRRGVNYVENLAFPDSVRNPQTPAWQGDPDKVRKLTLLYTIGGQPHDGTPAFRNATDVAFDSRGNLFVLDFGNKSIEMFDPEGHHLRTLGIGPKRRRLMLKPVDITVDSLDRIYVCDRKQGVLIFAEDGRLLKTLNLPFPAEQVGVTTAGELVVLAPTHRYLLHRFTLDGVELLAFAKQESEDAIYRAVFGKGALALDRDDNSYVSFVYPYRVVKYNAQGHPVLTFTRELGVLINPPTIKRGTSGRINQVIRQEVTFGLQLGPEGLLYVLVRTKGGKGGNLLDAFSPSGTYLQSLYLAENAVAFAFYNDELALVSSATPQTVKVFRIERL